MTEYVTVPTVSRQPGPTAPPPPPSTPEPSTADLVAARVLSVPGVAAMHAGTVAQVATYLPGRRVAGVRLGPESTEVHIALRFGSPVAATADAVRGALTGLVPGPVDVIVEDVLTDAEIASAGPASDART